MTEQYLETYSWTQMQLSIIGHSTHISHAHKWAHTIYIQEDKMPDQQKKGVSDGKNMTDGRQDHGIRYEAS